MPFVSVVSTTLTTICPAPRPPLLELLDVGKSKLSYDLSISLVSDYVSRDISASSGRPALQAGADINYALTRNTKISAGIWSSNVYIPFQHATKEEIDSSITTITTLPASTITLTAVDYDYPGVHHDLGYDGVEFKARFDRSVSADLTIYTMTTFSVAFANVYVNGQYFEFGLRRTPNESPLNLGIDAHMGRQWFEDHGVFAIADYYEYGLSVFRDWHGAELSVGVVSSNLARAHCFGGLSICGTRVVGSLTRNFSW